MNPGQQLLLERLLWTIVAAAGLIVTSTILYDTFLDARVAWQNFKRLRSEDAEAKYIVARSNLRTASVRFLMKFFWTGLGLDALLLPMPVLPENQRAAHVFAWAFIFMSGILLWDSIESNRDRIKTLRTDNARLRKVIQDEIL